MPTNLPVIFLSKCNITNPYYNINEKINKQVDVEEKISGKQKAFVFPALRSKETEPRYFEHNCNSIKFTGNEYLEGPLLYSKSFNAFLVSARL